MALFGKPYSNILVSYPGYSSSTSFISDSKAMKPHVHKGNKLLHTKQQLPENKRTLRSKLKKTLLSERTRGIKFEEKHLEIRHLS